ncbi:MAG: metallophosphoesterase family protein [Acidimicrobiia bacterium]
MSGPRAVRVAAVGDVHLGEDGAGTLRPLLTGLPDEADVLLLAGDLTRHGEPAEAEVLAAELEGLPVPVVSVLGNHDHHAGCPEKIAAVLEKVGVTILEGSSTTLRINGLTLGVAGTKGFGGGFTGACGSEFGEEEMKAFMRHSRHLAEQLEATLAALDTDLRVALLHYSPVDGTLEGEALEIYPFLGSSLLAQAIDAAGADFAFHGHAHAGSESGTTPGGVPVDNVAYPVIRRPYRVRHLTPRERS